MTQVQHHHETISTFLVSSESQGQASQNDIRKALESGDDEQKIEAMQQAIAALLNGEQLPALFITIVRYVLPSENHFVQKLLLLYMETISKTDEQGKLLPEMILICQNLRTYLLNDSISDSIYGRYEYRTSTRQPTRSLSHPSFPSPQATTCSTRTSTSGA